MKTLEIITRYQIPDEQHDAILESGDPIYDAMRIASNHDPDQIQVHLETMKLATHKTAKILPFVR